jgi:hypothetical protein
MNNSRGLVLLAFACCFWGPLLLGCSSASPSAIAPDGKASPDRDGSTEAPDADVAPESAADRISVDLPGPDAADANADVPDTADRPDMESINVCEGVDAGTGCGKRFQACCKTVQGCEGSLRCGADGVCHSEDCGDFMQKCCCAGGARRRCGPDLLCQSGVCSQP